MNFALAGKAGAAKGILWPVQSKMIVGRDPACDISLNDSTVSRRHCVVALENGDVSLEDLGSSNATLVNGRPKRRVLLQPGDEIAIGNSLLVLCRCGALPQPVEESVNEPPTSKVRIGESGTLISEPGSGLQGTPRTIEDLAELFSIGRDLSRASSVDGLITILLQRLSDRFMPGKLWICRCGGDDGHFDVFPQSHGDELRDDRLLRTSVDQVIGHRKPLLLVHQERKYAPTTMIVPVASARELKGLVLIQNDHFRARYEEQDLELLLAIANATAPYFTVVERLEQLERENTRLLAGTPGLNPLIGSNRAIQYVRTQARSCARSNLSILITGETGTGKELLARMIHELSPLAGKPIVTVNCAAIPEELFESELFGHERGSFTGAHARKVGLLEEVSGGTLFLDEVGDLSLQNQARLLRAIETKTFRRVGGTTDISVEFRLISATNRNLHDAIHKGGFRGDFFHRLAGMELHLPPLRDRRSDIPELAFYFLQVSKERHRHNAEGFEPETMRTLERRDWPGNIRELRNIVERAAVMANRSLIRPEDLVSTYGPPDESFLPLAELERRHISEALRQTHGNVQDAATILGIGRSTLYRKIEEFRIPAE